MADQFGAPPTVYDKERRVVPAQWLVDAKGGYVIDPMSNQPYLSRPKLLVGDIFMKDEI